MRQFTPGIKMRLNMHLEWLPVIRSHFPAQHANKHVHNFPLQRQNALFNRQEAAMDFPYQVCQKWEEEIKTIQTNQITQEVDALLIYLYGAFRNLKKNNMFFNYETVGTQMSMCFRLRKGH